MWYLFLGMLYFCIGTTAVCGNFIVLKIFSSFPALRTPANMLVMNLAFSDFLQSQHAPDRQLHLVHRMGCGSSGRLRRLRTRRNPRNLLVRLRHTNLHQPDLHPAVVHFQLLGTAVRHSVGLLRYRPGCLQTRR